MAARRERIGTYNQFQDTMRLDRPRDKRDEDTRVRNTCPFRGLAT